MLQDQPPSNNRKRRLLVLLPIALVGLLGSATWLFVSKFTPTKQSTEINRASVEYAGKIAPNNDGEGKVLPTGDATAEQPQAPDTEEVSAYDAPVPPEPVQEKTAAHARTKVSSVASKLPTRKTIQKKQPSTAWAPLPPPPVSHRVALAARPPKEENEAPAGTIEMWAGTRRSFVAVPAGDQKTFGKETELQY